MNTFRKTPRAHKNIIGASPPKKTREFTNCRQNIYRHEAFSDTCPVCKKSTAFWGGFPILGGIFPGRRVLLLADEKRLQETVPKGSAT